MRKLGFEPRSSAVQRHPENSKTKFTQVSNLNLGVSIKYYSTLNMVRGERILLIQKGNLVSSFRVDTSGTLDKLFINMENTGRDTLN